MRYARARPSAAVVLALGGLVVLPSDGWCAAPDAGTILRAADRCRGLAEPYKFHATIQDGGALGADDASAPSARVTVVEVHSDGSGAQLIVVLEPHRGDLVLKKDDVLWLRPRRLHRVTRIPLQLRMFQGAAASDIVAIDLVDTYRPSLRAEDCWDGVYALDLVSSARRARYPRAVLWVECEALVPRRIEFMASSGKVLKAISYVGFASVFGQRIATRLSIEDHVFKDVSIVEMSRFERIAASDVVPLTPDYVLAFPPLE